MFWGALLTHSFHSKARLSPSCLEGSALMGMTEVSWGQKKKQFHFSKLMVPGSWRVYHLPELLLAFLLSAFMLL